MISQVTQAQSDMQSYQLEAGARARKLWPDKPESEILAYQAGIIAGWKAARNQS